MPLQLLDPRHPLSWASPHLGPWLVELSNLPVARIPYTGSPLLHTLYMFLQPDQQFFGALAQL
jgi:hypothetical protein